MFNNRKLNIFFVFAFILTLSVWAEKITDKVIQKIKNEDPKVLEIIQYKNLKSLENYHNRYYYITSVIGQKSLRSLLGCLKNQDGRVRKICADYLYQLKVSYIHKKYIAYYYERENFPPAQLALQDLLVKVNMDRFLEAKATGDRSFLAKINYDEIADFIEKGLPDHPSDESEREKAIREYSFYAGGLRNKNSRIRSYSAHMLFELHINEPELDKRRMRYLLNKYLKKEKNERTKSLLNRILNCTYTTENECNISPDEY